MASFADYVKDVMAVLPAVNGNPMLSVTSQADYNKYREDPFYKSRAIQERDRLALEEAEKLKKEEAVQSGSGMMGGSQDTAGRNYYQEIEDRFFNENLALGATPESARTLAQQQAFDVQSQNNTRLASGLNLFANAFVPGMAGANAATYGAALPDYLMGNYRTMMGDTTGYVNPTYAYKPEGVAAPVVSASQLSTGSGGEDGRGGQRDTSLTGYTE